MLWLAKNRSLLLFWGFSGRLSCSSYMSDLSDSSASAKLLQQLYQLQKLR